MTIWKLTGTLIMILLLAGCSAGRVAQRPTDGGVDTPRHADDRPSSVSDVPVSDPVPLQDHEAEIDSLVMMSEQFYNQAVLAYEEGNLPRADSLFCQAFDFLVEAKLLATKHPAAYNAFKKVMDRMYADLSVSLMQLDSPSEDILTASEEELEKTSLDTASLEVAGNGFELPIDPSQPLIQKYLQLFQEGKRREFIEQSFRRAGTYKEIVLKEIRARNLPEELWLVALIESGYKTSAYSRAQAAGLWQFIPGTARKYGLIVNEWLDERRDPVKSTRAALTYLEDLYKWFNSWDLAMAAYNRGEMNIHKDMVNSRIVDFYEMAEAGATHPQTQNHVPQIHAAAIIARDPEAYGFQFEYDPPFRADSVVIDYVIDLSVVAKCVGVEEEEIKAMNPELRTWVTPLLSRDYSSYLLKLPVGTKERYLASVRDVKDLTPEQRLRYIVKHGDTLSGIARRFGVDWHQIKRWKNLSGTTIQQGQSLIIRPDEDYRSSHEEVETQSTESQTVVYVVKKGDTLIRIASRHGVSVSDLKQWNDLDGRRHIYPGQELKICLSADAG